MIITLLLSILLYVILDEYWDSKSSYKPIEWAIVSLLFLILKYTVIISFLLIIYNIYNKYI